MHPPSGAQRDRGIVRQADRIPERGLDLLVGYPRIRGSQIGGLEAGSGKRPRRCDTFFAQRLDDGGNPLRGMHTLHEIGRRAIHDPAFVCLMARTGRASGKLLRSKLP